MADAGNCRLGSSDLSAAWERTQLFQRGYFLVGEDAAASEKAHSERRFYRETGATAGHNVNDELRVLPGLELSGTDIERAPFDAAETYVLAADPELARRVAHWRAAITAAAGLVKQQVAMGVPQCRDDSRRRFGDQDTFDHRTPEMEGRRVPGDERTPAAVGQKNPMAFGL